MTFSHAITLGLAVLNLLTLLQRVRDREEFRRELMRKAFEDELRQIKAAEAIRAGLGAVFRAEPGRVYEPDKFLRPSD